MENADQIIEYSYVGLPARIAIYDDLLSEPKIIEVLPDETTSFIGALSAEIYNQARAIGSNIPFSAIKQVTENFIHAQFQEIVVSVLDGGNTIRFTDQGPGIQDKEKAVQPGFSSATTAMKKYIDGVGSGLPIVREYLDIKHGHLTIEDNIHGGAVVTLTLTPIKDSPKKTVVSTEKASDENSELNTTLSQTVIKSISTRARNILLYLLDEEISGVKDISTALNYPLSSTHTELKKLEESGLIEKLGKKRVLSPLGKQVAGLL